MRTIRLHVLALGLALVVLTGTPLSASANDQNATIDRFFDAYRSMAVPRMLEMYATDAVFVDVAQRHRFEGSEELREFLGGLTALHAEMDVREKRRVAVGDLVVVEYLYTGTLSGEALRKATGKESCRDTSYEIPVTSWFEIDGGEIVRQTDFMDIATLEEVRAQASGATD